MMDQHGMRVTVVRGAWPISLEVSIGSVFMSIDDAYALGDALFAAADQAALRGEREACDVHGSQS